MRSRGQTSGPKSRRRVLAVARARHTLLSCGLACGLVATIAMVNVAPAEAQKISVPRFASLKADRVVVRQGPSSSAPELWIFHRLGWPVEVLRESEGFSEVRDSDGAVGWVATVHLSGRRTAIVVGQTASTIPLVLRSDGRETARVAAELEPGLQAVVMGCDGRWCRLMIGDVKGWLEQTRLWGVYAGERIE
jgi:SH3-like domain-containing protein